MTCALGSSFNHIKIPLLGILGSLFDHTKGPPFEDLRCYPHDLYKSLLIIQRAPTTIVHKFITNWLNVQKISFNLGWVLNHLKEKIELKIKIKFNLLKMSIVTILDVFTF